MKMCIFSVFDSAAKAFLEPFFAPTIEVACRMFRQIVNREDHQFQKFPEDYTLFHLGEFDQATGEITVHPTLVSLGVAVTYIEAADVRRLRSAHPIEEEVMEDAS